MRADRLEDGNDIQVLVLVDAGQNGSSVDKNTRSVETGQGNEAGGHVLVASSDGDHSVHSFRSDYRFDRIGDHFLETSEYLIPGVPMLIPSETVMVPKGTAFPPALDRLLPPKLCPVRPNGSCRE